MYCPQCGIQNKQESRFCRRCGMNLQVVSQALTGTLSGPDKETAALERQIETELVKDTIVRRRRLLTAGTILCCAGFAVMIMLSVLGGKAGVVGIIPFTVGLGLILSALLIYRPGSLWNRFPQASQDRPAQTVEPAPNVTRQIQRPPESVTSETTRHLEETPRIDHIRE